jgi:predicted ester cyclase
MIFRRGSTTTTVVFMDISPNIDPLKRNTPSPERGRTASATHAEGRRRSEEILMSEKNKAVIRRLIDEVWNRRAFDVADELFAPEATIVENGLPLPQAGPAGVKAGIGALCAAFPDVRIEIEDLIAAEDRVVLRWSSRGTHRGEMQGIAPTNREVVANGIAIYRFAGGKVVEEWMNTDYLGILKQLGVIP